MIAEMGRRAPAALGRDPDIDHLSAFPLGIASGRGAGHRELLAVIRESWSVDIVTARRGSDIDRVDSCSKQTVLME